MRPVTAVRPLFAALVAVALLGGLAGGLLRAGQPLPAWMQGPWLPHAALAHAFLMVSGFMGTVIAIERAVAVKARWAFAAPLLSAAGGVSALCGDLRTAAWLAVTASAVFIGVNGQIIRRQREAHTALLLCSAAAWFFGSLLFAAGMPSDAVTPWWLSFLVLTIAAERLEMTRLMPRRSLASPLLQATLATLVAGAALAGVWPRVAQVTFGIALAALAAWLLAFDVARRTVAAHGLSRYMAVCLLTGYGWLGIAGLAWVRLGWGLPTRDAALHALALGFVVSMMLAHAPVILPAIARVRLAWHPFFYAPLAALHLSLWVRLAAPGQLRHGAVANVAALALFIGTVAAAALRARRPSPSFARDRHAAASD